MATLDDDQPSFLRQTAQRAGHLVLWAPRHAIHHLPSSFTDYLPFSSSSASSSPSPPTAPPPPSSPPATGSPSADPLTLPSPITYLTSPYLFAALFLAFLLNRIHHLVPPSRSGPGLGLARHGGPARDALRRATSPAVQLGLRLPAALLLLRAAIALGIGVALAGGAPNEAWDVDWLRGASPSSPGAWWHPIIRSAVRVLVWSTSWATRGPLGTFLALPPSAPSALPHPSLLWHAFLALSLCLVSEMFVRALSDDLPNPHHLNLLSFSFLLHVHAAPLPANATDAARAVARKANGELYLYLLVLLGETLALQASYCAPSVAALLPSSSSSPAPPAVSRHRRAPRPHKLAITAVFSLLAQGFALRSWVRLFALARSAGGAQGEEGGEGAAADIEVFSTVWLNKLPEVAFEVVVVVSVGLRLLAALVRGEEISRESIVGSPALAPNREDEYAVALIKYTTHLLSSTRLSGLAYELSPLEVLPSSLSAPLAAVGLLDPPSSSSSLPHARGHRSYSRDEDEGLGVVLAASGDVWFDEPFHPSSSFSSPSASSSALNPRLGFSNELRRITVEDRAHPLPSSPPSLGSDGGSTTLLHLEGSRKALLWRFLALCLRIGLFLCVWLARRAKRVGRRVLAVGGRRRAEWEVGEAFRREREKRRERRERPEEEQEESDGGEWVPSGDGEEGESDNEGWSSSSSDAGSDGAESEDEGGAALPLALLASPSPPSTTGRDEEDDSEEADLTPYLLAHSVTPSRRGPLTRRRFKALLPSSPPLSSAHAHDHYAGAEHALSSAVAHRRHEVLARAGEAGDVREWMDRRRAEWREGRSRFCVVCTVEEREVVLWPCRCLCLCEPCRAALAERMTTSSTSGAGGLFDDGAGAGGGPGRGAGGGGTLCPTCRTEVVGFSRIYIP
ncbi:hypothetical protein JCM10207_001041 [Rhodosporidiobolus poonsookiae]